MENTPICYTAELKYRQSEQEEIVPKEVKELLKVIPEIEASKETLQTILAKIEKE